MASETTTERPPSLRLAREQSRRRIIDAASALLRERPYAKLSVGEIMERADIGRTIFYRHFDDLGELLLRVGREAIDELYEAQLALASIRVDYGADAVQAALELPVAVYHRHGPVLRGATEAAASDELVAGRQAELRRRFDGLVAEALRRVEVDAGVEFADVDETARALNLLSHSYLLDAFGREPRITPEVAVQTLSEIWIALITRSATRPA